MGIINVEPKPALADEPCPIYLAEDGQRYMRFDEIRVEPKTGFTELSYWLRGKWLCTQTEDGTGDVKITGIEGRTKIRRL